MARIGRRDTGPEMALRSALHRLGVRFRVDVAGLPGRPDIVLPRYGACVFVHGCFWHRHDCRRASHPRTNVAFWQEKFARNVARDRRSEEALLAMGRRVMTVWECALVGPASRPAAEVAGDVVAWLRSDCRCAVLAGSFVETAKGSGGG